MKFKDIDWRKGIKLCKWGPKLARLIDRLVQQDLITWTIGGSERYPKHRRIRSWDFGDLLHITLTDKGKRIARSRPRCANRARKRIVS